MLKLKKIAASLTVIALSCFVMGNLVFFSTRILDLVIDYPHYEWYKYKISYIHCLAFGLISCFYSYLCYLVIRYFFISLKWAFKKLLISFISFFIVFIGIGIASGGILNLHHPIAVSNIIIFLIMAVFLPLLDKKVFKMYNLI
ncbi:MAG: hypothetical protein JST62_02940 [Bacteroidetes bacterium]|nr:hypothetical protein [Bacteroidota bacterium]